MSGLIENVNGWSSSWAGVMAAITWQSLVLAAAVGAFCWALRRQSPGLRYAIWLGLSLKLLLLPLWSVDIAAPAWLTERDRTQQTPAPLANDAVAAEVVPSSGGSGSPATVAVTQPPSVEPLEPAWYRTATLSTWLFIGWLAVVLADVGRIGWQFMRLRALLVGASPAGAEVSRLVEQGARSIGLTSPPRVRIVDGEASPLVCGLLRPVLVLPASLTTTVDDSALRQIVLHELAHLKRCDLLTVWVIQAMRTAYWFNPAAHWIAYRAGLDRELACDRLAMLHSGASAATYARTLIEAAGSRSQPMVLNAATAARLMG